MVNKSKTLGSIYVSADVVLEWVSWSHYEVTPIFYMRNKTIRKQWTKHTNDAFTLFSIIFYKIIIDLWFSLYSLR